MKLPKKSDNTTSTTASDEINIPPVGNSFTQQSPYQRPHYNRYNDNYGGGYNRYGPPPQWEQQEDNSTNAATGADVLVKNNNTNWVNNKWRPMMGWTYMATCIFDFIVGPLAWSIFQIVGTGKVEVQWHPLTLEGAGLYHIAMGAVLGIAAFGRSKEKITGRD